MAPCRVKIFISITFIHVCAQGDNFNNNIQLHLVVESFRDNAISSKYFDIMRLVNDEDISLGCQFRGDSIKERDWYVLYFRNKLY